MTLHPHITLDELTQYCQLCHEHGEKCRRIRVEKPIQNQIRQITHHPGKLVKHLGITFIARN